MKNEVVNVPIKFEEIVMVMLDNSNNNNNNNKITKYFLLFASNKLLVMSKYGMTCDIIIHSKYFSVSDCLQSPANSL